MGHDITAHILQPEIACYRTGACNKYNRLIYTLLEATDRYGEVSGDAAGEIFSITFLRETLIKAKNMHKKTKRKNKRFELEDIIIFLKKIIKYTKEHKQTKIFIYFG